MELTRIGKYEIVARIGKGSMGEVFRAHDPVLKRDVAIKTMSASTAVDPQLVQRFHREAQSAARLNHPNIITVFDFGEEQGQLYMAMELLSGTDLKELIGTPALAELESRLQVMEQVAEGLAYAHGQGVVHRDLKPANIHVLPAGRLKILDFGLARLGESEMTRQGMVMGTPNYMSPEQVRGERADARSDIFSLGAVFYEILTSRRAFRADSMAETLQRVLFEEPEPVRRIDPSAPAALATLVVRALQKDPADRFQNAGEVVEALREARESLGASPIEGTLLYSPAERAALGETLAGAEPPTMLDPASASMEPTVHFGTVAKGRAPGSGTRMGSRGEPASMLPRPVTPSRAPLYVGLAVLVVALGVAGLWYARHRAPVAPPSTLTPADVAREQAGILTDTLIANQVELARIDLDDKDYDGALAQAEQALKLDPDNADAQAVVKQARATLDELDAAATEARTAFEQGDTARASKALGKVLSLDPRHPVAGELTAALNRYFRDQAEQARNDMQASLAAADKARARSFDGYASGHDAARDGAALYSDGQFAVATQRFLEARDGFEKARRAAEAAARPKPTPPPVSISTPLPTTLPATTQPMATLPPVTAPPATRPSLPAPPATAPPVTLNPEDPAVRQVIASYAQALESKNLARFKSLKPNLSSEDEKRLKEAFKLIKSQKVGIKIESVEIHGDKATVKVSRQDTINGRETPQVEQVFRLVQRGGAWLIEDIGR